MGTGKINIVIADDHPIFIAGVSQTLNANESFNIVGEAENGNDAIVLIKDNEPDVAILDIQMPGKNGFEVLSEIGESHISTKVILLTMHKNANYFYQAISLGAKGYILKENAINDLLKAVEQVNKNKTYISQSLLEFITVKQKSDAESREIIAELNSLTGTEKKILGLIAEWKTNKEIAEELFISPRTVGSHRNHISEKLNLSGAHTLIKFAIENRNLF